MCAMWAGVLYSVTASSTWLQVTRYALRFNCCESGYAAYITRYTFHVAHYELLVVRKGSTVSLKNSTARSSRSAATPMAM